VSKLDINLCCVSCADIIFCIYVYQRYIYRVDPKRVNEFGVSGEMLTEQAINGNVPVLENGAAVTEATDSTPAEAADHTPSKSDKKND
jgi:hypothetical protein